jgi:hypothetical protein
VCLKAFCLSSVLVLELLLSMSKCVVIDFGASCLRAGFGGEPNPRFVVPSPWQSSWSSEGQVPVTEWLDIIGTFLAELYTTKLMVRARDYRLFVCEPLLSPRAFRTALAYSAFEILGVPEFSLCPSPLATLFATGALTGLVVDIGADETRCLAIYEGQPFYHTFETAQSGASGLVEDTAASLFETDSQCIGASGDGGIAEATLRCLDKCPVDCRRAVASQLVVVGGGSMIPGVRKWLHQKICTISQHAASPFSSLAGCVLESLWVPESWFAGNVLPWVGGSVLSSVEHSAALAISRDSFLPPPAIGAGEPSSLASTTPQLEHIESLLPDWLSLDRNRRLFPLLSTPTTSDVGSQGAKHQHWTQDSDGAWSKIVTGADGKERGGMGGSADRKPVQPRNSQAAVTAVAGIGAVLGI